MVPRRASTDLTAKQIKNSKLYQHIDTVEKAEVVRCKARSLGFDPTFIAENIVFINGKPGASALLLAAQVKRYREPDPKYRFTVLEKTAIRCRIRFYERIDGKWEDVGVEEFTIEMAKRAGLLVNDTWRKYPEALLYCRCLAAGSRARCPDALAGGAAHCIEELAPELSYDEDGRPVIEAEWEEPELPPPGVEELKRLMEAAGVTMQTALGFVGAVSLAKADPDKLHSLKEYLELRKGMKK